MSSQASVVTSKSKLLPLVNGSTLERGQKSEAATQSKAMPESASNSMEGVVPTAVVEESMVDSSTAVQPSIPDKKTTNPAASPSTVPQEPSSDSNNHLVTDVALRPLALLVPAAVHNAQTCQTNDSIVDQSLSSSDQGSEAKRPLDLKRELVLIREDAREQRARTDQLMALLQNEAIQRRQAEQRLAEMATQLQEQSHLTMKRDLEARRSEALTMMYKAKVEMRDANVLVSNANRELAEAKFEALKAQAENQKLLLKVRELEGQRQSSLATDISTSSSSSESSKGYNHGGAESGKGGQADNETMGFHPKDHDELPDRILFMQREPLKKPSRNTDGKQGA